MDWSLAQELARRSYHIRDNIQKLKKLLNPDRSRGSKPSPNLGNKAVEFKNEIKRQYFTNHQLVSIFYDVISGMAHLQKKGFYHGALSPEWLIRTKKCWSVADHPFTDYGSFIPENLKLNNENGQTGLRNFFHKE
jgi:hypothetical protein